MQNWILAEYILSKWNLSDLLEHIIPLPYSGLHYAFVLMVELESLLLSLSVFQSIAFLHWPKASVKTENKMGPNDIGRMIRE